MKPSSVFRNSNTDKNGERHDYSNLYDWIFEYTLHLKNPICILEVGVSAMGNGSGHAFCRLPYVDYFVGIDPMPLYEPFPEKGIFMQMEAYDEKTVEFEGIAARAPYDILIDDGSHHPEDQVSFFRLYAKLCAFDGFMICEDIRKDFVQEVLCKVSALSCINANNLLMIQVPNRIDDITDNFALVYRSFDES